MTKFQRIARTSLFARMSLLFGLLVTVPLVISGILLSLGGWNIVSNSGEEVAEIGRTALDKTSTEFGEIAEDRLMKAAESLAQENEKRLDGARDETQRIAADTFKAQTGKLRTEGKGVLDDATDRMTDVAAKTLANAMARNQKAQSATLGRLNDQFVAEMQQSLRESQKPIRDETRQHLMTSWEASAARRLLQVFERRDTRTNQLILRLQLPLRTAEIVSPGLDEDKIPGALGKHVAKNMADVQRVVLVSSTGSEAGRWPDAENTPEPVDWSVPNTPEGRTRAALFAKPNATWNEEGIRQDEKSKEWFVRVAHKIIAGEAEPAPAPPDDPDAVQAMVESRQPTAFLVVDYSVKDLAMDAARGAPEKMQILLLQAGTGIVVSSRQPAQVNAVSKTILDQLPKADAASRYTGDEPFPFTFRYDNGATMLGRARYWADDGMWVVVAQPEEEVLSNVASLEKGINKVWADSLAAVRKKGMASVVDADVLGAAQNKKGLAASNLAMKGEVDNLKGTLGSRLAESQEALTKALGAELSKAVAAAKAKSKESVKEETTARAKEAARDVRLQAGRVSSDAAGEIMAGSRRVANRAAAQSLMNSAWLIPLFLVLALFLATLTARSLVKPINQLVGATQALAAGEYNKRIKVQGDDELARLAGAFNNMAVAIETGQAALQQSNDHLSAEKARIEGIVDSTPDGLVMLEPGGQVAFMNPTAMELLGLTREQLPEVEPFAIGALPALSAERFQKCLEAIGDREGVQEFEFQEPERCVLQLRRVDLQSASGRSYGQLIHMHDITRERVIDEMKSDFISLVSHELRTPLTSILGFSSYMLTGRLGEVVDTQRTALESIHRQAKRLSAIISDFLDVSRIESGKIEMRKEAIPVAQIAGRVIDDLRPQASEKQIHVSADAHEGPYPLVALGDEQRIAQVFTNLVGNALKFTEANGTIAIQVSRENGELLCRVADSGCGIPPDELERVFDRFYQVEKVVTRKTGGTGLGLAIVKNIVEAHGGRIWIDSEMGKGTQVSFTLPGVN